MATLVFFGDDLAFFGRHQGDMVQLVGLRQRLQRRRRKFAHRARKRLLRDWADSPVTKD